MTQKRRLGSPLIALGAVVLGVQAASWILGHGWVDVRTGLVLDPILNATSLSAKLEQGSLRGFAVLVHWLSGTPLALLCFAFGLGLTSLRSRPD